MGLPVWVCLFSFSTYSPLSILVFPSVLTIFPNGSPSMVHSFAVLSIHTECGWMIITSFDLCHIVLAVNLVTRANGDTPDSSGVQFGLWTLLGEEVTSPQWTWHRNWGVHCRSKQSLCVDVTSFLTKAFVVGSITTLYEPRDWKSA